MTMETLDRVRSLITSIDSMPTIPVILRPLLRCLDQPVEEIDVTRIVELISYDKSIAAQCVRMANSALFGRNKPVESVRTAVMNLGMWRVRDLIFSNSLTQVIPANRWIVEPTVFWRHSLGVALVCRKFAEILGYPDTEKAYLAGLLHDIGILDRKSTRLNSSHQIISYAVFCLKKKIPTHEEAVRSKAASWLLGIMQVSYGTIGAYGLKTTELHLASSLHMFLRSAWEIMMQKTQ